MSSPPRIGVVAEGPSDRVILGAALDEVLCGSDYVLSALQPPTTALASSGPLGGGWRGVMEWCRRLGAEGVPVAETVAFANHDVVIVQIDADIAQEPDLAALHLHHPCPPALPTCDAIRSHLLALMGISDCPAKLVVCVPAQNMETWVLVALYPGDIPLSDHVECLPNPKARLYKKPEKLVVLKDGQLRNQPRAYGAQVASIRLGWGGVTERCSEAAQFEDAVALAIKGS